MGLLPPSISNLNTYGPHQDQIASKQFHICPLQHKLLWAAMGNYTLVYKAGQLMKLGNQTRY